MFVFNWHFACLFALSVALGFQISLLVACFLDMSRLWKYSTNTTISFFQNSRLFFWKKLAIPLPAEKNPGCSTGFECLISHWLTWRSVRTYGRSDAWRHNQTKISRTDGFTKISQPWGSARTPSARAELRYKCYEKIGAPLLGLAKYIYHICKCRSWGFLSRKWS